MRLMNSQKILLQKGEFYRGESAEDLREKLCVFRVLYDNFLDFAVEPQNSEETVMPDFTSFTLFLTAAFILAVTPGPGIFYVLTRSIKGGRREGYVSSLGTAVGGMAHVVAAALGLSAILATSALAFTIIKYAGAAYLVYLGVRTLMSREAFDVSDADDALAESGRAAFSQGITTEILNPKTALFFLAFLPQFINPDGMLVTQFILLGTISVTLNTLADVVVASVAGPLSTMLKRSERVRRIPKLFSGFGLIALGAYVAVAGE